MMENVQFLLSKKSNSAEKSLKLQNAFSKLKKCLGNEELHSDETIFF